MTLNKNSKRAITISGMISVIAIAAMLSVSGTSMSSAQVQTSTAQSHVPIATSPTPFVFELPNGAIDGVKYQGIVSESPLAEIQRSGSASLPIVIRPATDKPVTVVFHTTFGSDQLGAAKMPPGVSVTVEPQQVTLLPGQDTVVNLKVSVAGNAPDGMYHQELIGKWDGVNGFVGTSVILKIGNGASKVLFPEDIGQ